MQALSDRHVLIVGAGPAGLALSCALADQGFRVDIVEQQPAAELADPQPDGREIALTHRSVSILDSLGIWQRFAQADIAPIREARVLDGTSPLALQFDTARSGLEALGFLVPNHVIRKAAFDAAATRAAITLHAGAHVEAVRVDPAQARVELAGGRQLSAPLLIAADSRFSRTRAQLGIGAEQVDFGRTAIVCRLSHDGPADHVAYECFGYGRTLAILPLNDGQVSAVITVSTDQARELMQMSPERFADSIFAQFGERLGHLALRGQRYAYPLVAVYAHRFTAARAALLGDAAVGMHPVTAHGFNLGLYGVETLTRTLVEACARGQDPAAAETLSAYEREHRRTSRPLYLGTNALVGLYTDERVPARVLRPLVLRIAERLPPLKAAITRQLTGTRGRPLLAARSAPMETRR